MTKKQLTIDELFNLIEKKKGKKDQKSYTSQLFQAGDDLICRKVGEEAVEVIIAAFSDSKKSNKKTKSELVGEICDLYYHTLALQAQHNISLEEIYSEFQRRRQIKTDSKTKVKKK